MIIHECEQGTEEWLALRAGKPTASNFSKLVTSTGAESKSMPEYAVTLAGELYAGKPLDAWDGNAWTDRGTELEDAARAKYEMLYDVDVVQVGFVTNDQQTHGCSPDGLVGDDGGTEFKCLKAENHIKALMYYNKHKKTPTTYAAQVQGEIYVCEREWFDIVFYHPDLPMLVIRNYQDLKLIKTLESQLEAVAYERDLIVNLLKEAA